MKNYWRTNPEKAKATRRRAMAKKPEYYQSMSRVYAARVVQKAVRTVIGHYSNGTFRCKCCGESERDFLTLDHVNGNGNKERMEALGRMGGGYRFYRWLIKRGFPPGYAVLCMNCNLSKGKHGMCAHERRPEVGLTISMDAFAFSQKPSGPKRNSDVPLGHST